MHWCALTQMLTKASVTCVLKMGIMGLLFGGIVACGAQSAVPDGNGADGRGGQGASGPDTAGAPPAARGGSGGANSGGDSDPGGDANPGGGAASGGSMSRGGLCAPCSTDDACDSGHCLRNDDTAEMFCGQDCDGGCPSGSSCRDINHDTPLRQCVPSGATCQGFPPASSPDEPASPGEPAEPPPPPPGDCDPGFLGPFCQNNRIIGFEPPPMPDTPAIADVRRYSLAALNHIRGRTCLPPLAADDCLDDIAQTALETTPLSHQYFIDNCLGKGGCRCDWAQENIGAASGSSRTWKDGVEVPLCGMMTEPKGVGHRKNIESSQWKRVGVGITWTRSGASWHHEFGR